MQKQSVPPLRYIELLNEEIKLHPFYRQGMQFTPSPDLYRAPRLLDINWDRKKWSEYDFVFTAAARVVRARYEVKS